MTSRLLLLGAAVALVACSESDPSSAGNTAAESSSPAASCVADFVRSPCDLLTAERLRSIYPELPADVQQQDVPQITSCSYIWPSDGRTMDMTIGGNVTKIPLDNEIGIRWIKQKTGNTITADFQRAYRTLSDEERARAAAMMNEGLEKRTGDLSETGRKVAADLGNSMISSITFDAVSGIGTAAAWGGTPKSLSLKVLDGDTEFEIVANVSNVEADNRALAEQVARSVLEHCR